MKASRTIKLNFTILLLFIISGFVASNTAVADEPYDPEKILQIPHQSILNNEKLPGTIDNSGSMYYCYPFQVAPGTGGLEPEVSLVYNSGSKQNSWVGLGWSLDFGSIERSKKKRINFNDSTDSFSAHGVDLVRRPEWGSNYYFCARIEKEFNKYFYSTATSSWDVRMADGRLFRYGTSANSKITTASGVMKWLLSEIRDANGNTISIEYDVVSGDEYYPKKLNYAPTGTYVQFILESRNDRYPLYTNYTKIQPVRRLKEIQCFGYGGYRAHRYVFTYDYSGYSKRSLLKSIQEYGSDNTLLLPATTFTYGAGNMVKFGTAKSTNTGFANTMGFTHFADVNGDGFTDLIKFGEIPYSYVKVFLSNKDGVFGSAIQTNTGYVNETGHLHFGDLNGDGKADFVKTRSTPGGKYLMCYYGKTDGTFTYNSSYDFKLKTYTDPGMTQLADVNGDGLADLTEFPFPLGGSYACVHLADATGRLAATATQTQLSQFNDRGRVFMADVNGDGLSDVIQTNAQNCNAYVYLADGTGNFDTTSISTNLGYTTNPGKVYFADFNGDGLSDLAVAPTGTTVYTFFANGRGGFESAGATTTGSVLEAGYVYFGDVNGDGFSDMIKCPRLGNNTDLYLGDGTGVLVFKNTITTANDGFPALVDINGDGLSDLVKSKTSNAYVYAYLAEGLTGGTEHADILKQINHGYGVVSAIRYALSTRFPYVHAPSTSYPNAYLPFCLDMVDQIVVNDGIGNSTITTGYSYFGARYDIKEKEYIGLSRIVRTNPNNTTLTSTYQISDYYLKGCSINSNYKANSGSDYLDTTYSWEKVGLVSNAYWVRMQQQNTTLSSGAVVSTGAQYRYHYHTGDYYGHLYETEQFGSGEGNLVTMTDYTRKGAWIWRLGEKRISLAGTIARHASFVYDNTGNCTQETKFNNIGGNAVIKRGFDAYGNVSWEDDANTKRTSFAYTANTFVFSRNFQGLTTTYTAYNQWGKPQQVKDPNSNTTIYTYDQFGRTKCEDYPGSGKKDILYYDTASPRYTVTSVYDGSGTAAKTYEYTDGLGRLLQTTVGGATNNHKTTRLYYDGAGRNHLTLGPFFTVGSYSYYSSATIPATAPYKKIGTYFDFLDRPKQIETPRDESGVALTVFSYSGFDRSITDPDKKTTIERRDYLGRIQTIQDADNKTTQYDYNGAGDLIKIVDALGFTTTRTHNTLGQLTTLNDPDLGRRGYTYKPNGEVLTLTDQQGQMTQFEYNDRNQLSSKTYTGASPAEPAVTLSYDSAVNGQGRLFKVVKGAVTTTLNAYDEMGRVTKKTITIDGVNYGFDYGYDPAGNLISVKYPDGFVIGYDHFPGTSLLTTVTASSPAINVVISNYQNFDQAGSIKYPGITTSLNYFSRTGRVHNITVPGLMSPNYSYSAAGDVTAMTDAIRTTSYTYTYDNLHRLRHETASGPFTAVNNLNLDLKYEATGKHAVSRVVSGATQYILSYEGNGNLTSGYDFSKTGTLPRRQLDYNAEDMPISIIYTPSGGAAVTTSVTYDGENRRVKKVTGANKTLYVDKTYEIVNGQTVKYVFADDLRLAKITGAQVEYYHKDALSSTSLATTATGVLKESLNYEPFGCRRQTLPAQTVNTAYTFTDQEWDGEFGLYNYDARLYDPSLGRFLSADNVVPNWHDPQLLDRYAYARNNPLKYVDPDGHFIVPALFVGAKLVSMGVAYFGVKAAVNSMRLTGNAEAVSQATAATNTAMAMVAKENAIQAAGMFAGEAVGVGVGLGIKAAKELAGAGARAAGEVAVESASKSTAIQKYFPDNNGFLGTTERKFLMKGDKIDRVGGSDYSRFFSPEGTPSAARSLPAGSANQPLRSFEVVKPFEVESGTVAPAFGQPGLGTQYRSPVQLKTLIDRGVIREITP